MQVYDKDAVTLTLSCDKQSDSSLTVTLTASNLADSDVSGFTLQAAVPKVRLSIRHQTAASAGDEQASSTRSTAAAIITLCLGTCLSRQS